jgi:L-ascorbate metabolism protein UlaG (beta-lactamase superfamily)
MHAPPIKLADLSGIDAVLISHDHYDHLDMKTIQHLASQGTQFYVGLGVGAHLERWKVAPAQIHEMDWWESLDLKGVQINCTPARHYSGRKRPDNSTLWASWVVKGAQHCFYFSGDTGYADHFRAIRARFGATDLYLIKIGAYGRPPSWLDIHMDPESAVRANQDLGGGLPAARALGHVQPFKFSDEPHAAVHATPSHCTDDIEERTLVFEAQIREILREIREVVAEAHLHVIADIAIHCYQGAAALLVQVAHLEHAPFD